ncbi:MAG TPA: tetratricopeptide repeat protein, partial [Thermoplasmata archaeon]|nr:tetratricopeptide repeat protein [Thermoplasmata archaeon]
ALRDNQRFLMAKSSMTRALRTAAFAIGLAIALLLAITPALATTLFSDPLQVVSLKPNGSEVVTFTSPDALGLTFVTYATVGVTNGSASVAVKRDNVTVSANQTLTAGQRVVLTIEPSMWAEYANWSLVFLNLRNVPTLVTFDLQKGIIPTLFTTVPVLVFLYGATQIGWWFVLRPIRDRTKATSLRSAAEIDSGERMYDPSAPIPDAPPTARPVPMKSSFVEPPPPARSTPPPPPVPALVIQASTPPIQTPTPPLPRPMTRAPIREPETAETLVRKAAALVATGNYEAALVGFVEALRLDGDYVPALQGKARCQERLNQHAGALETYRRILAKDRRNVDSLRAVARLHMEERHWRECLESVEDLLRLRPNEAAALEMKGDALTNLGRRPEALAAYEAAATVDPSDANLRQKIEEVRVDVPGLLSRALIASASGKYTAALNLFDDILEVEPSNVNALIGKAVAYRRSGKPQEALNCLDLVLGVQPGNSSALLNRGNILSEQGELEEALDSFDRLTQLYPNDEEAWVAEGEVLLKMGRDDDAQRAFTEALKLSPGDEAIQRRILELEAAKAESPDLLEELVHVKGIGRARAKALIDAGFHSPEDFAKATPKSLMAVKGVTRKVAEELLEHFRATMAQIR